MSLDPAVTHEPELNRYELRLDGRLVGFAEYRREDGRVAFTHTEIDPEREGRGLGSALVRAALDDARRQNLDVVPLCPFVAWYIDRHPEYASLLPSS
jgi:uncharacterized protein